MRQKKNVLLYCADAVAGEQMKFLLEVRSLLLRVTAVSSPEKFLGEALAEAFDCVVVYRSNLGGKPLAGQVAGADAWICALIGMAKSGRIVVEVTNGLPALGHSGINRVVMGRMPTAMADVVNAVVMACARKRGPISGMHEQRNFSLAGVADRMVA